VRAEVMPSNTSAKLLLADKSIKGVILSDQLKSIDLAERNVDLIFKIPGTVVEAVQSLAITILTK